MHWSFTRPPILLRLEGIALIALALVFYTAIGGGWLLFILVILAPDLALLARFAGREAAARIYNAVHTYVWPSALFGWGFLMEIRWAMAVGIIWGIHVAADRTIGFGLKYEAAGEPGTHLQRVGVRHPRELVRWIGEQRKKWDGAGD